MSAFSGNYPIEHRAGEIAGLGLQSIARGTRHACNAGPVRINGGLDLSRSCLCKEEVFAKIDVLFVRKLHGRRFANLPWSVGGVLPSRKASWRGLGALGTAPLGRAPTAVIF